ncbi:MAG TPA: FAD-dependent oxidoreductase, partial [Victivallales bacterium]|nr:FAD-dependent oxidoreductase [Victivallales bacterium]
MKKNAFKTIKHKADLCVIGGGMAGICAAISAARHGAKTVFMHERPVLGGNASSECRVHICGADRHNSIKNMRETGILEEIRLENLYRNPTKNYSIWDTVLYEKVKDEKNITLLLNCTCLDAKIANNRIKTIRGWQLTTESYHEVESAIFADCSGDAVLAPLTGAEFRMGREAKNEFNESIEPEVADTKTMGMTCLFAARKYDRPMPFLPPHWAYKFESCDDLPYGKNGHKWFEMGYWWIELGEENSIEGTEETRDELLKIVYG